ncbi:MAG: DUF4249 family protein [Weeksellaceae bacterium]|nr:DUF4249 family protein [Weeksellaceae bacterium]
MKNLTYPIFLTLFILLFTSCEKEIEVDTRQVAPKLFIEANVVDQEGESGVQLRLTQPFNATQPYTQVMDASVEIVDESTGSIYQLIPDTLGIYRHPELLGEPGHLYHLRVMHQGVNYTAEARMPYVVPLDSLSQEAPNPIFQNFSDANLAIVKPNFIDPAEFTNFYQLRLFRNDSLQDQITAFNDTGFSGQPNIRRLFLEANPGDIVQVEKLDIDRATHDYLLGLWLNTNQTSATPTNPVSNISGNALGLFKVAAVQRAQITIIPM